MRHLTFAVIGHVDHGKTALTRALTGVDTDRLAEEKRRGLTIEPGFAPLSLPRAVIGLVDDPGHEKFIPNLLAASAGIDAILLVVDAAEGPRPQTWEHLALMTFLGVTRGLVVLTKADLLSPEAADAGAAALSDAFTGTILEHAPVLPVSSKSGAGLDRLRDALDRLASECPIREDRAPFRLPVDRAFSVPGFGPVVTGTVWTGRARPGDPVQLYPTGHMARIRGLQRHGKTVADVRAGERAALNLSGVDLEELRRGLTAAAPGSLTLTQRLNAQVTVWDKSPVPLSRGTSLRMYLGSASVTGRAYPLTAQSLLPGDRGPVQLRLDAPLALRPFDRFVLRLLSPTATLGGGQVLDPLAPKRKAPGLPDQLADVRDGGYPALARLLLQRESGPVDGSRLARRMGVDDSAAEQALLQSGSLRLEDSLWISPQRFQAFSSLAQQLLSDYHQANPLIPGMNRNALAAQIPEAVLASLARQGALVLNGPTAALPGFRPAWPRGLLPLRKQLLELYDSFALDPPENTIVEARFGRDLALVRQAARRLEEEGVLIPYSPRRRITSKRLAEAEALLRRMFAGRPGITLAQFRDAAAVNRDAALRLLEYFDTVGLTRREGNIRVLCESQKSTC
ncbi:MAG: selenocysteine-specific translation elongation factor [Clostridiales bacterium]|nr:selenocysteine-specific translation elongation factor [Clostridiales bacterium]